MFRKDLSKFDTIIFDFGGVIFDINPEISRNAFIQMGDEKGMKQIEESEILWQFERGEIDTEAIHKEFCNYLRKDITLPIFVKTWNALLLNYKPERIKKIKELAKSHKLLMLSNTNEIHYSHFAKKLNDEYGITFHDLFSHVYLSFEMGYIKPDANIFKQVLNEQKLIPEKTLFIEDSKENAEAANALGIETLLIPRNGSFFNYFL